MLHRKINSIVKSELELLIGDFRNLYSIEILKNKDADIDSRLISCLQSEIEFLRNEIKSKDEIITLLVNERGNYDYQKENLADNATWEKLPIAKGKDAYKKKTLTGLTN